MYSKFDFHLHTQWSYDALSMVEDYFKLAKERGVKYIAITEHPHMDSYPEVKEVAKRYPEVKHIPAAEMTVWCPLGTYDLVCLGMPETPTPELQAVFDEYHQWQRDAGDGVCKAVQLAGFPYTREDRMKLLKSYRPQHIIDVQGCTHVRGCFQKEYLVDKMHYFKDAAEMNEAISRAKTVPHYPEAAKVIPVFKKAGALVLIAHPRSYFHEKDVERMDALREMLQLDGAECNQTDMTPELTAFYREYCVKYGMLSSAGCDAHTFGPECKLGTIIGDDVWLEEILDRLPQYR